MGQVDRDLEELTCLRRVARRTGKLLRGGEMRSGLAPQEAAMDEWLRAMSSVPRSLRLELSFASSDTATLELLGAERPRRVTVELGRIARRVRGLGLERVLWRGGAAEHELFQSVSLLLSITSLPGASNAARDLVPCLAGAQFQDVHFGLRTGQGPESKPTAMPPPERKLGELLRDTGRVLVHDIRSLPARSPEREALLRILLALLSQAGPDDSEPGDALFHETVEQLDLRQEEWRELVESLDPHAPKSFLWAFLDQIPENPAPELYAALLSRAPEVLPTLLEHASSVRQSGVHRILQLLLEEQPNLFEQALETGSPLQAHGALLVYEQGGETAPRVTLRQLALRFGAIELRCQAARMLQRADPGGSWAVELLEDPVRELRRIALQVLSARSDRLSDMIASYQSSESALDAEERRWRLFAIAACGNSTARAFVHEHLDAFPEASELSEDELPEQLAALRNRISL